MGKYINKRLSEHNIDKMGECNYKLPRWSWKWIVNKLQIHYMQYSHVSHYSTNHRMNKRRPCALVTLKRALNQINDLWVHKSLLSEVYAGQTRLWSIITHFNKQVELTTLQSLVVTKREICIRVLTRPTTKKTRY